MASVSSRRASAASEKKNYGMCRNLGQCTGEIRLWLKWLDGWHWVLLRLGNSRLKTYYISHFQTNFQHKYQLRGRNLGGGETYAAPPAPPATTPMIYVKIQSAGFTNQYIENVGFALLMKMLPRLAFVPESQVIHYFNLLMEEFPTFAIEIAEYFEDTYIGRLLPNHTRRKPPFPIRLWNLYTRVNLEVARTNNSVEGWQNGFQSGISYPHPSFTKLLRYLQLEQSLQEAMLTKWESGEVMIHSKQSIVRSKRIITIVSDFANREPIGFRS